jgi:hypothetical protein
MCVIVIHLPIYQASTMALFIEKGGNFATGHRYFLSFAKRHYPIVSLPEHTALPKRVS